MLKKCSTDEMVKKKDNSIDKDQKDKLTQTSNKTCCNDITEVTNNKAFLVSGDAT